jgi:hypothetical protein
MADFHCLEASVPNAHEIKDVLWFIADYRQGSQPTVHKEDAIVFVARIPRFKDLGKIYWRVARADERAITP